MPPPWRRPPSRVKRSGFAWVGLLRPGEEELADVAGEFGVHSLAVEDAMKGHQRSKLERYGDNIAVVVARRATSRTRRRSSLARSTCLWVPRRS